MNVHRRCFTKSMIAGLITCSSCSPSMAAASLRPEDFGAIGDGVAPDGAALAALVDAINAVPGTRAVHVRIAGTYNMGGAPRRRTAPMQARNVGYTHGLPPVTRSNVFFDAMGSTFIVPPEFAFRRIQIGGGDADRSFVLWHFVGDGIRYQGGVVDGNLGNRPVQRGNQPQGFGGADYGFVLEGKDWSLSGVRVANWGTDCALVMARGKATNCIFERARRNGVSVVPNAPILAADPVTFDRCMFVANGQWPDDIFNNPASGLDVESGSPPFPGAVVVRNSRFRRNRLKDLVLSTDAADCQVYGNQLTGDLRLEIHNRGGHKIYDNEFSGDARILVSSTSDKSSPVSISNNRKNGMIARDLVARINLRSAKHRQIIFVD